VENTKKNQIQQFSNEFLLDQYINHTDEYTPEALVIIEEEINTRGLGEEQIDEFKKKYGVDFVESEQKVYSRDDFIPFEHEFSHTDVLLVRSILQEYEIPFYVLSPSTVSSTLPIESEATIAFKVYIHKEFFDRAQEFIHEHFEFDNGRASVKYATIKDRLTAVNFFELSLTEAELDSEVNVQLTQEEQASIMTLAQRVAAEADEIEKNKDKVLFYYDNLEPLIEKLEKSPTEAGLTQSDLLTIIEILQIYCDEPEFPDHLNSTIDVLLDFFSL
jgi:hypothetical protein